MDKATTATIITALNLIVIISLSTIGKDSLVLAFINGAICYTITYFLIGKMKGENHDR